MPGAMLLATSTDSLVRHLKVLALCHTQRAEVIADTAERVIATARRILAGLEAPEAAIVQAQY
jgi:hypothetical protein